MAKKSYDFLSKPTEERVRKEIQNICDSYSHPWDVLAELAQNSVDAIRISAKANSKQAFAIQILIDARTRTVEFSDSGIGFPISAISDLLAPHGTNKNPEDQSIIGQKGVGLTYVVFNCDDFQLETQSPRGYAVAQVRGASGWRRTGRGSLPLVEIEADEDAGEISASTKMTLKGMERIFDDESDLFSQSVETIVYWLRTKTAIGDVSKLFGETPVIPEVTLEHVDAKGNKTKTSIPFRYYLPEEFLKPSDVVKLNDIVGKDLSDKQKEAKLRGKCLKAHGVVKRAGRSIRYYAFFVPSRNVWQELSEKNRLQVTVGDGEIENLVSGGIFVATRGMPTGIELTPPASGNAGYWPNCFFLFEDNSLSFDLGRKSIPGRTQGLLKEVAHERFNELTKLAPFATGSPSVTSKSATLLNYAKTKEFEALRALPDLGLNQFPYLKHPDGQEAAVVSIFQQMIASGKLRGYQVLRMGYKSTYDLWGTYSAKKENIGTSFHRDQILNQELPVVIEFKVNAEDLVPDLETKKFFTDIDLLVCWDFDEKKLAKNHVTVEATSEDSRLFHGASHHLVFGPSYSLGASSTKPVIVLRQLIDSLKRGK